MPKFIKKLTLSFLLFLIVFTSFAPYISSAKAQEPQPWYSQDFAPWYIKVFDEQTSPGNEIFGERYTAAQVQWVVYGLVSMPINFLGKDMRDFVSCMMKLNGGGAADPKQCLIGVAQFLIKVVKIISPIVAAPDQMPLASRIFDASQRPISGIGYIQKTINRFSLVGTANAAGPGFGYSHLGLVIPFWTASRDISFVFLIIAVIIFAFMIMFRVKINPQTVITIQSALPKVIGALILSIFSLAIAGFVIDLMYVVSGVFATLMATTKLAPSPGWAYTIILGEFKIAGISATSILGGPVTIFMVMFVYTALFFVSVILNAVTSILLSLSLVTGTGFTIVGLALTVWLLILVIWYTIKLTWIMFRTTINIYLSIIIAPLQIMFGVFAPNVGFGLWLRNLIANVLVFPVTGLFLYLAFNFLFASYGAAITVGAEGFWDAINSVFGSNLKLGGPAYGGEIKLWSPPWIGQDVTGFIFLMMSFGLIIMLPKVLDLLKSIIMGEKFSYGTAINEAMTPINWVRGSAPARALTDYMGGEGAYRLLDSGLARELARRFGRESELDKLRQDFAQRIRRTQ